MITIVSHIIVSAELYSAAGAAAAVTVAAADAAAHAATAAADVKYRYLARY